MGFESITINARQNLFDIAIDRYGNVGDVLTLIKNNPAINLDTDLVPGNKLVIEKGIIKKELFDKPSDVATNPIWKRVINAKYNQNIFDVALQEYGSVEGVLLLAKGNTVIAGIGSSISAGMTLYIKGDETNPEVVEYYKRNNVKPATKNQEDALFGDYNNDYNNDYF